MDDVDRAQLINEAHLAESLARITGRGDRPVAPTLFAPMECINCDEPIPERRRAAAAGCTRCVGCQEADEARRKR